jgi:biotin carboxylase
VELVHNSAQALSLNDRHGSEIVLKPLTGSGSELTFVCHDSYDLGIAYRALIDGLTRRSKEPMYCEVKSKTDHSLSILAEQYIDGREYSADFIIDEGNVRLIRVARKIKGDSLPFGTTLGYSVPAVLPGWLSYDELIRELGQAARSLGLFRAICMADIMITHDQLYFIELTPRIGGDCLPSLVRASTGIDTIGLALDFAERLPTFIPPKEEWKAHIGLRLLAAEAGVLASVDGHALAHDPRVKEIYIKHDPGHEIILPPDDYSSWVLGHVVFEADQNLCPKKQCDEISSKMSINVEQYRDQKLSWFHDDGGRSVQPSGPAA